MIIQARFAPQTGSLLRKRARFVFGVQAGLASIFAIGLDPG